MLCNNFLHWFPPEYPKKQWKVNNFLFKNSEKVFNHSFRLEGGSGVIFACLAHMKVPFITEQPLSTEGSYRAVSKSYWALTMNVCRWTTSLQRFIEGIWSKLGYFGLYFSVFWLTLLLEMWTKSVKFWLFFTNTRFSQNTQVRIFSSKMKLGS